MHRAFIAACRCLHRRHSHSTETQSRLICSVAASDVSSSAAKHTRAAILVIGDEVLSGAIQDTNTPWLAKLLHSRGVDVLRAEYVPDDVQNICDTVQRLRTLVGDDGAVFSSGGIGPTHDDVTYEAIAKAFGAECAIHAPTLERMVESYSKRGLEVNAARQRMATLPHPAEVLFSEDIWVPLVNINSVYILPGIPKLFRRMVEAHQDRFQGPSGITKEILTSVPEGELADDLRLLAAEHPKVKIGSYPNTASDLETAAWKVKLQLDSRDEGELDEALQAVSELLASKSKSSPLDPNLAD